MSHFQRPPRSSLRSGVQWIWGLETPRSTEGEIERIAPDGIVEAVFHYGVPTRLRRPNERFEAMPTASLVSQTRRFIEIQPQPETGFIAVRFRPWGAHHFLGAPISAFADTCVDAREIWDSHTIAALCERIAEPDSMEARASLVEDFLETQLRRHQKDDIEGLVRSVWSRRGDFRIAAFCRDLGWSERRLERTFANALGVSPKSYARLVRFLGACEELEKARAPSITTLAHRCGYYDQAHLVNDFRSFSGLTPGEFRRSRGLTFLELG